MGRGNTSWEKRQREKMKRERKDAKRSRRDERKEGSTEEVEEVSSDELMAQFAEFGRQHAAGQLSDADFETARTDIFEKLGLGSAAG